MGGKKKEVEMHRCGECANITPVTRFHTLNIYGEPTLGTCPYWIESRCTLLSWLSACEHFRQKVKDPLSATG